MTTCKNTPSDSTATHVVDDAVGMEKSHWYVAIVNHNTEKRVAEKLEKTRITHYLPIQTEYRIWTNGRKVKIDRIVIPSTIFIYCSEQQRREIVGLPYIKRFMINKAGSSKDSVNKPLAIIPDSEIDHLKFMLGQSDIPIEIIAKPMRKGDRVKVIRGSLSGLEGEILHMKNDQSELIVSLELFGCARLSIDTKNLEIIK